MVSASKQKATQPQLQRTWLRQGGTRREKLSQVRVKATSGARAAKPLNNP